MKRSNIFYSLEGVFLKATILWSIEVEKEEQHHLIVNNLAFFQFRILFWFF